ncbi:hypothetical protein DC3_36110 [Deinococcus cellulosilyticus NBRC 106333 = KACC 11606]|uniref:Uncharacterized protein n=1 Tax=Deinococcus cellulosilyticus (strain DSM 18568 / NBRC 106333 / KACC 11606 / 5516J-15) TaxID=1223518 RepID=A0A511N6A7_DEIC1|nr:hypothetical protein DC3_36110 [Deinococcus cellulosilyticus NBRC 106333 = KACC 11606]
MPHIFKVLLPLVFSLLPWLGVHYERIQGSRHAEVSLRPLPIPELTSSSVPAPQLPSIKSVSPPVRFFPLPWFVHAWVKTVRVRETVLFLPYSLPWLGRMMLDGG